MMAAERKDEEGGMEEKPAPVEDKAPRSFWGRRKPQLVSAEVTQAYGAWVQPSEIEAEDKYHKGHPQHAVYAVKHTGVKELGVFGQGHMLYFYFLKYMAIVFGVLSLLPALPQIIMYIVGGWLVSADVARTTMGNFGLLSSTSGNENDVFELLEGSAGAWGAMRVAAARGGQLVSNMTAPVGAAVEVGLAYLFTHDAANEVAGLKTLKADKKEVLVAMSVLSLIGCLGFFVFSLVFMWWTGRLAKHAEAATITIRDFSVRVEGVPMDVTAQELHEYFEQWGEVVLVELARACNELMALIMDRKHAVEALDEAVALLQRKAELRQTVDEDLELEVMNCKYDLQLVNAAILRMQEMHSYQTIVDAFVTFKDEESLQRCLQDQPRSALRRALTDKASKLRGTHTLNVTQAPNPTDMLFENLEFKRRDHVWRYTLSFCIKVLLLLLGFVLVSLAPAIQRNLGAFKRSEAASDAACAANCKYAVKGGQVVMAQELRDVYRNCDSSGLQANALSCEGLSICYECYCYVSMSMDKYAELNYCNKYQELLIMGGAAQALTVLSIVLVNLLIPELLMRLAAFEKHHTRSVEARSAAKGILVMFFLNTCISIIIANAYLPRLREYLGGSWMDAVLFGGIFPDMTPEWYNMVGRPILISQFVGIASREGLVIFNIFLRWWRMKRRHTCLTQRSLNRAYEGHAFQLADRYGEQINVVFVCLMYGGAMPLLYWVTGLSFLAAYWVEKYELLKVVKQPINYTAYLGVWASEALPFACLWHLLIGMWAFSFFQTQKSKIGVITGLLTTMWTGIEPLWTNTVGQTGEEVANRMMQANAAHLFWALFIFAAILFLLFTFLFWVRVGRALVGRSKGKADQLKLKGAPEFDIAVRSKVLLGPASYSMQENPNYEDAFVRMEELEADQELAQKIEERMEKRRAEGGGLLDGISDAISAVRDRKRRQQRERAYKALDEERVPEGAQGQPHRHRKPNHPRPLFPTSSTTTKVAPEPSLYPAGPQPGAPPSDGGEDPKGQSMSKAVGEGSNGGGWHPAIVDPSKITAVRSHNATVLRGLRGTDNPKAPAAVRSAW